jgi:hypothetical protein
MTGALHSTQASGRWFELPLVEQLANIGTEVARAIRAKSSAAAARTSAEIARIVD